MVINILLKSKRKIILITILFILIFFTIFFYVHFKNINFKVNGKKIDFSLNNLKSYDTIYDMTVISNKNIHTYRVEEKCNIENNHTILRYLDYMKNTVTIELKDNLCSIVNSGNMLGLNTQITSNNKNISSFSTFIYIYKLINGKCNCKKEEYLKDDEIKITLNICNQDNCVLNEIGYLKDLSKLELILKDKKPLTYILYDKNKKEFISILYNIFKINEFEE